MHNPFNTVISFVLMIAVVGGSFYYVYALAPRGPWMGITAGGFLNPEVAAVLELNQEYGFLIFTIAPASPAARAGLQGADNEIIIEGQSIPIGGDILVSIDGKEINTTGDVCSVLTQKQAGDTVRIGINRDGEQEQVNLILEEAPQGQTSEC